MLLMHAPIIALTGSALLSHALLGLAALTFFALASHRIIMSRKKIWIGGLPSFLAIYSLASLGVFYSIIDQGPFNVQIQFFAVFILLPILWMALSEIANHHASHHLLLHLLLAYVIIELVIISLQITFFLFGVGIPPSEQYGSMVSGSQFNANNLAAIVVTLSIFFNASSQSSPLSKRWIFNSTVILILLITFSRLAIILYILDQIRYLTLRRICVVLPLIFIFIAFMSITLSVEDTGNETIDTALYKARSLITLVEAGIDTDSSTSSRAASYINFTNNLGTLGVGSASIFQYSTFTSGADFMDKALYTNPHSMLIEFSYWMGWLGLLALIGFLLMYVRSGQGSLFQRWFLIGSVLLATSIPSSAIPLPPMWVGLLLLAMLGPFSRASKFNPKEPPNRVMRLRHQHLN